MRRVDPARVAGAKNDPHPTAIDFFQDLVVAKEASVRTPDTTYRPRGRVTQLAVREPERDGVGESWTVFGRCSDQSFMIVQKLTQFSGILRMRVEQHLPVERMHRVVCRQVVGNDFIQPLVNEFVRFVGHDRCFTFNR